jgi:hypothetical protein
MSPLLKALSLSEDALIVAESKTTSDADYREINNCLYEARKLVERAITSAYRMETK